MLQLIIIIGIVIILGVVQFKMEMTGANHMIELLKEEERLELLKKQEQEQDNK